MERVTFPDPGLQNALSKFELCKIDVDAPANRELCAKLQRGGAVPTFVVLGDEGEELLRWVGALDANSLVAKLGEAKDDVAERLVAAGDDHGERAEIHAARGDLEPTLQEIAALTSPGAANAAVVAERVCWLLCMTLRDQQRWSDLDRAARHYLDGYADREHADDARVALGLATFARTGMMTPELQAYIDRLVTVLGEPFPERSLTDRILRFFGSPNESSERTQEQVTGEWCGRINATMEQLSSLGGAALPALHRALRDGDHGTAGHAGTVIGRIRDPQSREFLLELLDDGKLDTARRTFVVTSLAMYKDLSDLPRMLALARSHAAPGLRAAAIDAMRSAWVQSGGTTDTAIADALSEALHSRDLGLRLATLQAMCEVRAPLALEGLLDAMDDQRAMFEDFRVCDNALLVFENQIGCRVVNVTSLEGERCTPALAAFAKRWYGDARTQLRWDAACAHWVGDPIPHLSR